MFIRTPSAPDSRQERPVKRAASAASEFSEARDQDDHETNCERPVTGQQRELGPDATERKEQRQKHDDHEIFELLGERVGQPIFLREHGSEQKGSEQGMNPDQLGAPAREKQENHDDRHDVLRESPVCPDARRDALENRSHHVEHEADIERREERRGARGPEIFGAPRGHDKRQDAPGCHVIDRRTGDRHRAHLRAK